jgi:carbon-monoxide dehydrogenase medium subunit
VIPVAFDYARPSTVEDAVAALAWAGDDAKVLAGGQSLLPVLRLRLAAPTVVVDLGAIASLRGIRVDGDDLVVGAMATHAEVASSPLVQTEAPLVAVTAITVGDRQVRHRGTLGGSLAHADPAGDLPAAAVALDATIVLVGPAGRRSVAARDFFTDIFTTSI